MRSQLPSICVNCTPKTLIDAWGDDILGLFLGCKSLVDEYDVYDELSKYWEETMQDDAYMISRDGWKVTVSLPKDKKGNVKKNFTYEDVACDLLPSMVLVKTCFADELSHINALKEGIETADSEMASLAEDNSDAFSDFFNDKNKVKLADVKAAVKAAKKEPSQYDEADVTLWTEYVALADAMDKDKKTLKEETAALTQVVQDKYAALTDDEVRELVFAHKWMPAMRERLSGLMTVCQQRVSTEMHELNARYVHTLGELTDSVSTYESAVMEHLKEMGFNL